MAVARPIAGPFIRETTLAKPPLPDQIREIIQPVLPVGEPSPMRGHPRLDDRKAPNGIFFVLKTGIPWKGLPREMGCGCGMTCWWPLRDWQEGGTWLRVHHVLLDRLHGAGQIDRSRGAIDSRSVRPAYGGGKTGPSPVDRAEPGSKHHVLIDGNGIPLASSVTTANVNDIKQLAPLFNAIPPVGGRPGRSRRRPDARLGDRGYDSEPHREGLRQLGVKPYLAENGTESPSGLGVFRWVVERTLSWTHQDRRLRAPL